MRPWIVTATRTRGTVREGLACAMCVVGDGRMVGVPSGNRRALARFLRAHRRCGFGW